MKYIERIKDTVLGLKSNMDRFIVMDVEVLASAFNSLKSNMDRFIALRLDAPNRSKFV